MPPEMLAGVWEKHHYFESNPIAEGEEECLEFAFYSGERHQASQSEKCMDQGMN